MRFTPINRLVGLGLFLIFSILLMGCTNPSDGTVQGFISIGPLCPVETSPPDPTCQPTAQTYLNFPITVFRLVDGAQIEVNTFHGDATGFYELSLTPGNYLFSRNDRFFKPIQFTIQSNETLDLNIQIDTGIR